MIRSLLLIAISLNLVSFGQCADDEDVIANKLSAAKAQFDEANSKARDDLLAQLNKNAAAAQQVGDLKALEKIEAEIRAFESNRKLPTTVVTKGYVNAVQVNRNKMSIAFASAVKEYTKAGMRDLAKAIQQELDEFSKNDKAVSLGPPLGEELVKNPGCEEPLIDGRIPGWTSLNGQWGANPDRPASGKFWFHAPAVPSSELYQDVDITSYARSVDMGKASVQIAFQLRCFTGDKGRVVLEFRDAENKKVLAEKDTGEIASPDRWQRFAHSLPVPKETRTVRIRLISKRSSGRSNDGNFDDLSLRLTSK